jgi:hypothetical protein
MAWRRLVSLLLLSCACSVPTPEAYDASVPADAGLDAGLDAGADAGLDAGADAGLDAGSRRVMLGFSPFWADQHVPFGNWSYDFLPMADFVSVHADDFFGVPFDAFATTRCAAPPSAKLGRRLGPARGASDQKR